MHDRTDAHDQIDTTDDDDLEAGLDLRELLQLHPRLLMAAGIVSLLMLPVGALLAAIGVFVLDISGGAADDTSAVVGVAGYAVADFWGGGLVTSLTRVRAPQVAVAWTIARLVVVVLVAALVTSFGPLAAVQVVIALPAAYAGARVARKQAALRRQIQREQAVQAARDERRAGRASRAEDAVDALS